MDSTKEKGSLLQKKKKDVYLWNVYTNIYIYRKMSGLKKKSGKISHNKINKQIKCKYGVCDGLQR